MGEEHRFFMAAIFELLEKWYAGRKKLGGRMTWYLLYPKLYVCKI